MKVITNPLLGLLALASFASADKTPKKDAIDTELLPPAEEKVSRGSAQELMMSAIHRGVKLFNHGQHGASANIYELAAGPSTVPGRQQSESVNPE